MFLGRKVKEEKERKVKKKRRKEATEDLDLKRKDRIIEMREKLWFLARVWRVESFVDEGTMALQGCASRLHGPPLEKVAPSALQVA